MAAIANFAHVQHGLTNPGYDHRALSRSASPYRRKRTRSPSPYRNKRTSERSPSPFRHGRKDRGHDGKDSRSQQKRKPSSPRGSRPEKRHNTDRSRHGDHQRRSYANDLRNGQSQPSFVKASQEPTGRPHVKPLSYAEIDDQTPAVPGFSDGLIAGVGIAKQSNDGSKIQRLSQQVTRDTQKLGIQDNAHQQAQQAQRAKNEAKDTNMYVRPLN